MKKYTVIQYSNFEEFHNKVSFCGDEKSRFFTVKLYTDRISQIYEGTVYFEISGEFIDSNINQAISNLLNPKYNHIGLYQIFEVTNKK